LLALAGVALVVGAVAWATVPDSNGVVHLCYKVDSAGNVTKDAHVRVIDPSLSQADRNSCKKHEGATDVYSKSGADAAFLGASAKAADSDKLDGIDSTGFIQGAGLDFRKSSTLTTGANLEELSTPYGTIELACANAARYSFRRFAGSGGGQTIRVFDQTNGGAPQFYTINIGFTGAVYQPTTPFRSTWEMIDNDGTSSLEVDIWVSFISQNRCDFITHWSYAPNPS